MKADQLHSARLARWSQNGDARLTREAAAEWLGVIGLCAYLPGSPNGSTSAPSFLEAVVGRPAHVPSAGERSRANEIFARMVEQQQAVPLKFGAALGEQPDFVASPEALRYIYSLRGNRKPGAAPATAGNDKVTPLARHCWEAIEQHGALDVAALGPILGRDITEAAIARALQELWIGLYILPVLDGSGKPAKWELLHRLFPQQAAAGATTGQAESLSAMVSLYLHAVVAAAEEDVIAFLSPLAAQSKLREVIRGLSSMRQLDIIDIAGHAHVSLQGGLLPEMVAKLSEEQLDRTQVEDEASVDASAEPEIQIERAPEPEPRRFEPRKFEPQKFEPRKFASKKFVPGTAQSGSTGARRFDVQASASRQNSGDGKAGTRGLGERARRWEKTGERPGGQGNDDRSLKPASESGRPFPRKPSFKTSNFKGSDGRPGAKPWAAKGASSGDKPAARRFGAAPHSAAASRPDRGDRDDRPKRWEKPGAGETGARPYAARTSGSRPAQSKPWARKSGPPGGAQSPSEERPKRWENRSLGGAAASRGSYAPKTGGPPFSGKNRFAAGGPKPWASGSRTPRTDEPDRTDRPKRWAKTADTGSAAGSRKPAGGSFSARPDSARPGGGAKPWMSRGAESRVGSAKSYAARSAGKPRAPKPWAARTTEQESEAAPPKRREKPGSGEASSEKKGEKKGAKPFWAGNPRGGKGSAAAGRTNRPGGGKRAGGKGGKRK